MNTNEQYKAIGGRIKLRRTEFGLKQNELANQINISKNHMSAIETGREKPSLDILLDICRKLQVTPDYILLGNIQPNNISQNIIEGLRLCSEDDIELVRQFIELLIVRNRNDRNNDKIN